MENKMAREMANKMALEMANKMALEMTNLIKRYILFIGLSLGFFFLFYFIIRQFLLGNLTTNYPIAAIFANLCISPAFKDLFMQVALGEYELAIKTLRKFVAAGGKFSLDEGRDIMLIAPIIEFFIGKNNLIVIWDYARAWHPVFQALYEVAEQHEHILKLGGCPDATYASDNNYIKYPFKPYENAADFSKPKICERTLDHQKGLIAFMIIYSFICFLVCDLDIQGVHEFSQYLSEKKQKV